MTAIRQVARQLAQSLVDPPAAARSAAAQPVPWLALVAVVLVAAALGAATLPRQLDILSRALALTGDPIRDLRNGTMHDGLLRLIVIDRLVPPPTLVLTALLLVGAAEPVLALPRDRHRLLWAVVLLGLTPILVLRLGELAVTYAAALGPAPRAGDAVSLPHDFSTGPVLLWPGDTHPPVWLRSLSQRINLLAAWSVALWAIGLRELDGRRFATWQVLLPASCLAVAAVITWWLSPMSTALLLGRP